MEMGAKCGFLGFQNISAWNFHKILDEVTVAGGIKIGLKFFFLKVFGLNMVQNGQKQVL